MMKGGKGWYGGVFCCVLELGKARVLRECGSRMGGYRGLEA